MGRRRSPKDKGKQEIEKGSESSHRSWSRQTVIAAAAVAILATAAMAPGIPGELLNWDDNRFIQDNELIRRVDAQTLGQIFAEPHFEAYHPLHLVSYYLDYQLFRLWAPGYKVHNLLLYFASLILLFFLLRRLGLSGFGAWAATMVFAVHPLHVEAVVWATARKEPLSLVFMLGAALAYLGSKRLNDRQGIIAIALFGLALLTKTSTLVLPALLFVIDVTVRRISWTNSLRRLAPLFGVALVVGLYVISLWEENEMARPMPERGLVGLVALVGKTYWHYLAATFWPARLSPVYPIDRVGAFDLNTIAGFLVWIAIIIVALRSKDRLFIIAASWSAIALLPVSNMVPVYFFVQDRYAFIATIGVAIFMGRVVELAPRERWRLPVYFALGAVIVALTVAAALQATTWRTSLSLWQRATTAQPESYYAQLALGHTLRDLGDYDAAIEAYGRAIELEPDLPFARVSFCLADARRNAARRGRPESEVDRLGSMLSQRWHSPERLLELAPQMLVRGYLGCAQLAESRSFDLAPPSAETLIRSASSWVIVSKPRLALRYLERIGGEDRERNASAVEVEAQALQLLGRREDARAKLRRSLELEPRPMARLLEAAQQLLERGRPELALLYADVATEGEEGDEIDEIHSTSWQEVRERANTVFRRDRAAPDARDGGRDRQEGNNE